MMMRLNCKVKNWAVHGDGNGHCLHGAFAAVAETARGAPKGHIAVPG